MNQRRRFKAKAKRALRKKMGVLTGLVRAEFRACTCYPWEGVHAVDCVSRVATDEEARASGQRMVEKHRKSLEALAAYDRGEYVPRSFNR